MASVEFSQAVLQGLRIRGFDDAAVADMTDVTKARLNKIRSGDAVFTDRQIQAIERTADLTGGQLAALTIEPSGGPFTELMNEWGDFAKSIRKTPHRARVAKRSRS